MIPSVLELVFWTSLVVVAYVFAGYPMLVGGLASWKRRKRAETGGVTAEESLPSVSVVLVAFNEEKRMGERLRNLMASDYPPGKLEIVVVSDGSTDGTQDVVRAFEDSRVRLVAEPVRRGKAHGLNRGVEEAGGEIVVFADARQRFEANAIRKLVARFAEPRVGAVSGLLKIERAASGTGDGIGFYWKMETFIRRAEGALGSTIGCTGAIYAIRRSLYCPIPMDTLLDDVVVPMRMLTEGHRVVFEPEAVAWDPQAPDTRHERVRKRRTMAGNYQMLFRYPTWLLPWQNRAWWQLISHKYLRLAAPWFLLLMWGSGAALGLSPSYLEGNPRGVERGHTPPYSRMVPPSQEGISVQEVPLLRGGDRSPGRWGVSLPDKFYLACFVAQTLLFALGIFGIARPTIRTKGVAVPAGFLFLNAMAVSGLFAWLSGTSSGAWGRASESGQVSEIRREGNG